MLEVFSPPWGTASVELGTKGTEISTARSVVDGDVSPGQAETL